MSISITKYKGKYNYQLLVIANTYSITVIVILILADAYNYANVHSNNITLSYITISLHSF